jgi:hypothetical protein
MQKAQLPMRSASTRTAPPGRRSGAGGSRRGARESDPCHGRPSAIASAAPAGLAGPVGCAGTPWPERQPRRVHALRCRTPTRFARASDDREPSSAEPAPHARLAGVIPGTPRALRPVWAAAEPKRFARASDERESGSAAPALRTRLAGVIPGTPEPAHRSSRSSAAAPPDFLLHARPAGTRRRRRIFRPGPCADAVGRPERLSAVVSWIVAARLQAARSACRRNICGGGRSRSFAGICGCGVA